MYRSLLRPLLFLIYPEKVHHLIVIVVKIAFIIPGLKFLISSICRTKDKVLETEICGITFPNPVGLAAGFDKDGTFFNEFSAFGFSHIEIGTITPVGQAGNPKPRSFRLPKDNALINRMGFNNSGVDEVIKRLGKRRSKVILGGNIGKNKITENEYATQDYLTCFKKLHRYVDYIAINISSPNTPNLRELHNKEPLNQLLKELTTLNKSLEKPKPIFLKISPDLTDHQIDDILEVIRINDISGVIATNTTTGRNNLRTDPEFVRRIGDGGLSGKPLKDRSTEVIRYVFGKTAGKLPIIGVGGITSPEDAIEKLEAGASLVQIYTGFIYEGPALVKRINKAILRKRKGK